VAVLLLHSHAQDLAILGEAVVEPWRMKKEDFLKNNPPHSPPLSLTQEAHALRDMISLTLLRGGAGVEVSQEECFLEGAQERPRGGIRGPLDAPLWPGPDDLVDGHVGVNQGGKLHADADRGTPSGHPRCPALQVHERAQALLEVLEASRKKRRKKARFL